jgi:membrane peptidoglycan carboxypeptidase
VRLRVPKVVRDAVIASEDRRFRSHVGLDLKGSARALLVNVRAGEVREGASTITQQLARGLFLGRERTFARKFREAGYALLIEAFLSKDQILEMYLNSIYWGQGDTRAIAGVEEAARWYFSAPAESLKLAEAALLAGLIPAPVAYSPFKQPALALARRNQVLADMAQVGMIDARSAARDRALPLWVRRGTTRADRSPDVMSAADLDLDRDLPTGAPRRWGLEILTTIDLVWQDDAERAVREGLAELDPGGLRRGRTPLQGAFVAIDPASGALRAIVGGRAQRPGAFNRAMQARRQTGSAIKPLVYAAALDPTRGEPRFTLRSRVPNLPKTFRERGVVWTPANADHSYQESLTLPEALARSANVATANLVEAIGPAQVARACERLGLGKLKPVLSIGWAERGDALDLQRLRHVRQRGAPPPATRRARRRRCRGPEPGGGAAGPGARPSGRRGDAHAHDARERGRHRHLAAAALGVWIHPPGRRQDRHDERQQGHLVLRDHARAGRRGVVRLRPTARAGPRRRRGRDAVGRGR